MRPKTDPEGERDDNENPCQVGGGRHRSGAARRCLRLRRPRRRDRRLRHGRQRQPAVAVGHPGPVRRLLRSRRPGHLRQVLPGRDHPRGWRRHRAAAAAGVRRSRLRRLVGPQGAGLPRGGRRHRQRGPGVPAVRHPAGVLGRQWHQRPGRPGRQGGRQLGLGQRVRTPGRRPPGGPRSFQRLRAGRPELRHAGPVDRGDRRRPGDDLQRVRPGARGRQPRHRVALHRGRPVGHRLERRRHRHAPGRHLGGRGPIGQRGLSGPDHPVRGRLAGGLGVLPRQRRQVRRHRPRQRLGAGCVAPGMADERDQRPHLAIVGRRGHDERRPLDTDGRRRHQPADPERGARRRGVHHRVRRGGPQDPQRSRHGHDRHGRSDASASGRPWGGAPAARPRPGGTHGARRCGP